MQGAWETGPPCLLPRPARLLPSTGKKNSPRMRIFFLGTAAAATTAAGAADRPTGRATRPEAARRSGARACALRGEKVVVEKKRDAREDRRGNAHCALMDVMFTCCCCCWSVHAEEENAGVGRTQTSVRTCARARPDLDGECVCRRLVAACYLPVCLRPGGGGGDQRPDACDIIMQANAMMSGLAFAAFGAAGQPDACGEGLRYARASIAAKQNKKLSHTLSAPAPGRQPRRRGQPQKSAAQPGRWRQRRPSQWTGRQRERRPWWWWCGRNEG